MPKQLAFEGILLQIVLIHILDTFSEKGRKASANTGNRSNIYLEAHARTCLLCATISKIIQILDTISLLKKTWICVFSLSFDPIA